MALPMITPELLLEGVVDGLMLGFLYALAAMGLSLIFGVLDIINFAHGDLIMLAAYMVYLIALSSGNLWIALVVTVGAFTVLGFIIYRGLIQPVIGKEPLIQIAITVGLGLVLQNVALALFRAEPKGIPQSVLPYTFSAGPLHVSAAKLLVAAVSAATLLATHLYLTRTRQGLAARAVADNRESAWLMGINVPTTYMLTFGLGTALTALAAFLWMLIGPVNPYLGTTFGLITWVIVALGGLGGVSGTLVAGLIVGALDGLGSVVLTPSGKYILVYIAFILTIWFRPRGLFGRR
ncbi:MAG: branched-chain amino acid ABC transporter permease [Desulfurococcaceae archaeon]